MRPFVIGLLAFYLTAIPGLAQSPDIPRAVRRDIPMQPSIRRAFARGTRDSTGAPGRNYWQQRVDYRIEATIDAPKGELRGSETITLHNSSPDTLKQVVLRLYQNMQRANAERNSSVTDVTEGVIVERVAVNGSPIVLTDEKQYAENGTIATVTPSAPVAPGGLATIDVSWRFAVPRVDTTRRGNRMGRYDNYLFQIAQWYPQVAMYDDMRGWDTDKYSGDAEFYNQFGRFDVKITAPGGWLVGATGDLQNASAVYSARTRERLALAMRVDTTVHVVTAGERGSGATAPGATLTWHFIAPNVNDFAFATSRDYVYDATHANIPGKGAIPVHVLFLPHHTEYYTNNTAQYGRASLERLSSALFPYEFSQGTIADGPERGMEYPMIIFNGSSLGVTVHEFAHQWFPMMVGSNETRYGFMDEGFDGFVTAPIIAAIQNVPLDRKGGGSGYRAIAGSEIEAPMMWPTTFAGPGEGVSAYTKAPLALHALGGLVGDSAVDRGMRDYALAWKFKHPSPWDFYFSMSKSLKRDLGWFWNEWFFTTHTFDQAIESATVSATTAVVAVLDKGDMAMPVIVRFDFADNTSQTVTQPGETWFGGGRRTKLSLLLRGRKLTKVTLDPDNRFQDLDRTNNEWVPTPR